MAVAASGMLSVHESCPVCTPDPDVVLEVIVWTTIVCAVNVPLTVKSSADDAVEANEELTAYEEVPINGPVNDPVNEPVLNELLNVKNEEDKLAILLLLFKIRVLNEALEAR